MYSRTRNLALSGVLLASSVWGQATPGQAGGQGAGQGAGEQGQGQVNPGPGSANPGGMTGFNPIGQNPWFANPGVRQQLNLNNNQFSALNRNYSQAWNSYHRNMNGLGNTLTPQQRFGRQSQLGTQFRQDFSKGLDDVFPDRQARDRFNQLELQYRGYDAFRDPRVSEQLNLTDAQRQKFSDWGQDWNRDFMGWQRNYAKDRDQVDQQFNDSRRVFRERINSTLTPEQRQKWEEMTGRPYDFDSSIYFPDTTSNTTLKPALPDTDK